MERTQPTTDHEFRQMVEQKKREQAGRQPTQVGAAEQARSAPDNMKILPAPESLQMRWVLYFARNTTVRRDTASDAMVDTSHYSCGVCFGCCSSSVTSLVCDDVSVECNDNTPCFACDVHISCCRGCVALHAPTWAGLVCCVPLQAWLILCATAACYKCGHEASTEPQLVRVCQCLPFVRLEHERHP
eukprot:3106428-Prymnesium_polylepis.2